MKKYISLVVFSLCAFFLFGFNIKALDFDINFDKHEHFNFFYEMKENTPFYQFLISEGDNLVNTLRGYRTFDYSPTNPYQQLHIGIFYISDIDNTLITDNLSSNSYYVICLADNWIISDDNTILFNDNSFSINFYSNKYSYATSSHMIYYSFDENGNYLSFYEHSMSGSDFLRNYVYKPLSLNDFDYFLSRIYYSLKPIKYDSDSIGKPTLRLNKIIVDNEEYYLKNYETISGWSQFWKRIGGLFTGVGIAEATDYSLDYYRTNYVLSNTQSYPGLVNSMTGFNNSVIVPSGYLSALFNLTDNVTLYPKTSCSLEDLALYVYSGSLEEKTFNLYLHSNSSTDELGYQGSYYSTYNFISNGNIKINPFYNVSSAITLESTSTTPNLSVSDFTNYYYRLSRTTNFGTTRVYYNTDCYIAQIGSESVLWTNPLSGNEISVDSSFRDWSDPQNIDVGTSIPTLSNPEDFGIDVSNWFSNAWNGAKSFIMAGVEIVSLSTIFFDSLPSEVSAIILCAFIIGTLLILIKLLSSLGIELSNPFNKK